MIYTTASDQGKAGEKSRYMQQMGVELGRAMDEEVIFIPIVTFIITAVTNAERRGRTTARAKQAD